MAESITLEILAEKMDNLAIIIHENQKLIEGLALSTAKGFNGVNDRFNDVDKRFDKLEFLSSSQERRISILEDKMQLVSNKLGLQQ